MPGNQDNKRLVKADGWSCPYALNEKIEDYSTEQVYPDGICPWLYHATYPYMLGLLYGADFRFNKEGDANVACPAANGCRTLVRRRSDPNLFPDKAKAPGTSFVIFTEVTEVGDCPKGHRRGDRFLFPTCNKSESMCPAAWYQAFPLMNEKVPDCIEKDAVRCPDWELDIFHDLGGKAKLPAK